MLRPRASGRGGGAGLSGRLRSRPGRQRDFKGAASAGLRIPGEGRREGAAAAFSFFFLTERSRAGWGRRSPFSFCFPLSLSLSKVHFRPTGFVGSLREALPAPSPPVPFLFACSPLWSCRWWLRRVCRYRPKSPGDPGSSENPEVQNARLCSQTPPLPVLLATPPPDTLSFCTPSSSFSGAPLRVLTRFGGSAARGVFEGILHRRNMCSGPIEA